MPNYLSDDDGSDSATPIAIIDAANFDDWFAARPTAERSWIAANGFRAKAGSLCLVPGPEGGISRVLVGQAEDEDALWVHAALPGKLPPGRYRLDSDGGDATRASLGWALGTYAFTRYKAREGDFATLVWPEGTDRELVARTVAAIFLVRDLVNTPAADMGPAELAEAAEHVARAAGAKITVIEGAALLKRNYPAIHAVGRASRHAPRLIDMVWGDANAPRVTLVGKGVCFDSGGLDIKPAAAMKLMKKDMGGAAHVLALGQMIMAAGLKVRLRILIPAVENAIGGDAMHPLDVLSTRKGISVEIGHTDAEGRLILADALTEADSEAPDLLLDFATLTGSARVALGPDLPALFSNNDELASALLRHGEAESDPMWRLPLWRPYRKMIDGATADLTNAAEGSFAGAITAALFLEEFVSPTTNWAHLDLFAWNPKARPGRPEGGEAMGLRAAYAMIEERFG